MKIRLNIRQKIFFSVLSVSTILYVVAVGYIVNSARKELLNDAFLNAKNTTKLAAEKIEKDFERDLAVTRTLAQAFSIYQELPTNEWQSIFKKMYKPVLEGNKHIYSIWDSWEFYGYVPNYSKDYGRYCVTLWRENDEIKELTEERSLTGDPDKYGGFKKGNQEGIWEPYRDQASTQTKSELILMTTIASPIQVNGRFMGIIGFDVSLKNLQEVVSKIEPVQGSFAFLVSEQGVIAAHRNPELVYTPLAESLKGEYETESIASILKEGIEHSYISTDEQGNQHFITFAPIRPGNSYSSMSLAISIPLKVITQRADENMTVSLYVGIGGLLLLMVVLIFVANSLTRPIVRITKSLNRMRHGEISSELTLNLKTGDEIEAMANAFNISIEGLNRKATFANEIGMGELESKLELLGENDVLGKSLLGMRDSLKKAKEEEVKRVTEDKKRTWANEGFARFAEILRQNNDDLQKLADEVLKNLVKYVEGNQGALFLVSDEKRKNGALEAASVYAWDRKKYIDQEIAMGEGLVGACALEQETIFLTEIPSDFITITSGLGEAHPNCVILIPLKQDVNIMGVIEIASFKIFEPFEVEFLEKVAQSIAATIASVKINAKTRFLLEQSQQQAEEMQAQEEEMRQNMEELLATQEEMGRKEKEIAWTMEAIGGIAMVMEYDFRGLIINVNQLLCNRTQFYKDELIGQHHSMLFEKGAALDTEAYKKFWSDMQNRLSVGSIAQRIDKNGKPFSVKVFSTPVFDEDGMPLKIVEVAIDISDLKEN